MLVEIIETFKKLSDGQIFYPGDILDIDEEKANHLISKGRARILPETRDEIPSCRTCSAFVPDPVRGGMGLGFCQNRNHHIWANDNSLCLEYSQGNGPKNDLVGFK